MSHISKAKAKVKITDKNILEQSLTSLKNVKILKNSYLYRELGGNHRKKDLSQKFDYVIVDKQDKTLTIGLKLNSNGEYNIYYDNWGESGKFGEKVMNKLNDWYLGYATLKTIKESTEENFENFNFNVFENDNGEIVIEAEESVW